MFGKGDMEKKKDLEGELDKGTDGPFSFPVLTVAFVHKHGQTENGPLAPRLRYHGGRSPAKGRGPSGVPRVYVCARHCQAGNTRVRQNGEPTSQSLLPGPFPSTQKVAPPFLSVTALPALWKARTRLSDLLFMRVRGRRCPSRGPPGGRKEQQNTQPPASPGSPPSILTKISQSGT